MRYRIHLNLCVALAAAQLIFVAGIDATEIKVGELLPLKLCLTDKTNSWTVVKPTKVNKMMQKGEVGCCLFLYLIYLKAKRHDISRYLFESDAGINNNEIHHPLVKISVNVTVKYNVSLWVNDFKVEYRFSVTIWKAGVARRERHSCAFEIDHSIKWEMFSSYAFSQGVCVAVAVMLHYFFTASFTWMCVEAIHMFLKIVSVFNIRITRMRYYVAIGWGKFRDMFFAGFLI